MLCSTENYVAHLNMRFGRLDINPDTSRVFVKTLCNMPPCDRRCSMLSHWTILESSRFSFPFYEFGAMFSNVQCSVIATRWKCGYGISNGILAAFSSQRWRKRIHFASSFPVLASAQWFNAHDLWKHFKCLVAQSVNIIVVIGFV